MKLSAHRQLQQPTLLIGLDRSIDLSRWTTSQMHAFTAVCITQGSQQEEGTPPLPIAVVCMHTQGP